jgi:hypothetical protein
VFVSHSLDIVKDLCTRAIWIYKGDFRLDGDPTFVIDEYLKQIAIDTKEEKKKQIETGEISYKGAVFIDLPHNYSHISLRQKAAPIVGWMICDCEKSEFRLVIGNKQIKVLEPVERKDVYDIYCEEYNGFISADTIGWKTAVDWQDYRDQIDEEGHLTVSAGVYDEKQKLISEKSIVVIVDKEKAA